MRRILAVTAFVVFFAAEPADALTWYSYGGHDYSLTDNAGTWLEAQAEAESYGGNLVTINDATENAWVFSTFAPSSVVWIGFHQPPGTGEPDDGWEWASGELVTFINWRSGQPNELLSGDDYAQMNTDAHDGRVFNGGWGDVPVEGWPGPWHGVIEVGPVQGDLDGDDDVDADDIDLLCDNMGSPAYDLDGDNDADEDDLIYMVENLVELQDGSGRIGTKRGDFNLNGEVNATDLAIMAESFGETGWGWSFGNTIWRRLTQRVRHAPYTAELTTCVGLLVAPSRILAWGWLVSCTRLSSAIRASNWARYFARSFGGKAIRLTPP